MHLPSLPTLFRRPLALFSLALVTFAAAPRGRAITNDDLLPANLAGKTLTFTFNAGTPNTLESINGYTMVLSAAGTFTRTNPIVQTSGGTYTVVDSSIAANTGGRVTTIICNNNWLAQGNGTAVMMVLTQANGIGAYTASEFLNPLKNSGGLFTIDGTASSGGGSATTAPVITSATTATATVGSAFSYQITATPAATSFTNAGGTAPVQINLTTGLVTGTFTTAGTFTFSYTALNSVGTTKPTVVTVTVTGSSTGGTVASYAGTYTGTIFVATNGAAETTFTTYSAIVSATGALVAQGGELTGTVNANGVVTFASNGLGLSTGAITSQRLNATGATTTLGTTTRVYRLSGTGYSGATAATAPTNLVGYRNKVGQAFQFTVTGTATGAVWGTDVYTDDSAVGAAAVHAGVLAIGETKTVTLTLLPGQSSYTASTRNGIRSSAWGSWAGSFSFAGAGAVAGTSTATTRPAVASGFVASTTSLAVGGRLVLPITITGGGAYSYQWYLNNSAISGATVNPYVVESLTSANAGTYTVDVTNSLGTTRLTAGTITVGASGSPVIALQPFSKTVSPGATFTLAASASGSGLTYQWFRNNSALTGETGAILLRQNVTTSDAGSYTVRVTNSSGSVTSSAATITLSANASRPANISVRTNVATGAIVTPGFVVQGTGTKRVLIRAVGPGLAAFGLDGTMADPKLTLFQGSTKITENDDWSAANIGSAFTATGAFAVSAGSKDAALVTDLAAGKDYSVQVTNASGTGGLVIIEVYDADVLKGTSTSKLVNVSVLGQTAPGVDVLTLGLVISGNGPRTLLVRGVGPKLAAFGVGGTVPDPRLQIFDSQQRAILANDDWGNADFVSELTLASNYVGAFALDAGSKDAATLALVEPGSYTIQVSGDASASTGTALVEVYEVP